MKKLLTLCLLLFSLTVFADNSQYQYCGLSQYGYLYYGELYTAPYGFGWRFPKPNDATWEYTSSGYLGAHNYTLQCNLPIDDFLPGILVIAGCFGFIYLRRLNPDERDN